MGAMMCVPFVFEDASVFNIRELNASFASGSLKVMYIGKNTNGSYFSREAVESALPSLYNVPIVCRWDEDAGEIGGHDMAVSADDDGNLVLRNLTEPCGVVPEHAQFSFCTMADADGESHEYLVVDNILLWKRQPVFRHIAQTLGGRVKHSMEIDVKNGSRTKDGYFAVTDFAFTALCLLENCEPCFRGSELSLYTEGAVGFKQRLEEMMREMREAFAVNTPLGDDIDQKECLTEGGEKVLREEKETFALEEAFREELVRVLEAETEQRAWGDIPRYCFVDYDRDACEVYCFDTGDWLLYGIRYETNGDAIAIKYETKKRKKTMFVDFDEGEQYAALAKLYGCFEGALRDNAALEEEYRAASAAFAAMQSELETLRQFKADTEKEAAARARDALFAQPQFEELAGVEEFEALRENAAALSAGELEERLYAIRGRASVKGKLNFSQKAPKLLVEKEGDAATVYGGIFERYGMTAD